MTHSRLKQDLAHDEARELGHSVPSRHELDGDHAVLVLCAQHHAERALAQDGDLRTQPVRELVLVLVLALALALALALMFVLLLQPAMLAWARPELAKAYTLYSSGCTLLYLREAPIGLKSSPSLLRLRGFA